MLFQIRPTQCHVKGKEYASKWLKNLYAFNSETYFKMQEDPLVDQDDKGSDKYVGTTRSKCIAVISKIYSLLFQGPTKKNWAAEITPIAELSDEDLLRFVDAFPDEEKQRISELSHTQQRQVFFAIQKEKAEEAMKKMTDAISDLLAESKYPRVTREVIRDVVLFGSGVAKKATIDIGMAKKWEAPKPFDGPEFDDDDFGEVAL